MPVKLQNILFLLGFFLIILIIYIFAIMFVVYGVLGSVFNIEIPVVVENIFTSMLHIFFPSAVVLGVINLFSNRFAHYIYNKGSKSIPTLRWYSMFISWCYIMFTIWPESEVMTAIFASCVVAASFNKRNDKSKRCFKALLFTLMTFLSVFSKTFDL